MIKNLQIATLGGGCFWCTEAVFQQIKGVEKVVSGYAGGNVPGKPTYREICSGLTGHAEVIQVTFDADIVSFEDIFNHTQSNNPEQTRSRCWHAISFRNFLSRYQPTRNC